MALHWLGKAAEQGDAGGQFNLGVMYKKGTGVPQDYAQATKWYQLAAEQGNARAQNNLGYMYATGKGVPQDYVLAHMWYNQAGANGIELGIENRNRLAKSMTGTQVAEAQQLASEWTKRQLNSTELELSPQNMQAVVTGIESITDAAPPAAGVDPAVRRKTRSYGPRHHGFTRRR